MIDIESIGSRVKYHRLRNKISQEELAELAQVSRVHISYLERGERIPSKHVGATMSVYCLFWQGGFADHR